VFKLEREVGALECSVVESKTLDFNKVFEGHPLNFRVKLICVNY